MHYLLARVGAVGIVVGTLGGVLVAAPSYAAKGPAPTPTCQVTPRDTTGSCAEGSVSIKVVYGKKATVVKGPITKAYPKGFTISVVKQRGGIPNGSTVSVVAGKSGEFVVLVTDSHGRVASRFAPNPISIPHGFKQLKVLTKSGWKVVKPPTITGTGPYRFSK